MPSEFYLAEALKLCPVEHLEYDGVSVVEAIAAELERLQAEVDFLERELVKERNRTGHKAGRNGNGQVE